MREAEPVSHHPQHSDVKDLMKIIKEEILDKQAACLNEIKQCRQQVEQTLKTAEAKVAKSLVALSDSKGCNQVASRCAELFKTTKDLFNSTRIKSLKVDYEPLLRDAMKRAAITIAREQTREIKRAKDVASAIWKVTSDQYQSQIQDPKLNLKLKSQVQAKLAALKKFEPEIKKSTAVDQCEKSQIEVKGLGSELCQIVERVSAKLEHFV